MDPGLAWAITLTSAFSRGLQAISYETARRNYRRWVYGVNWIRQDVDKAAKTGKAGAAGAVLALAYLGLSKLVHADDHEIEARMGALVGGGEPKAAKARSLYQAEEQRLVKHASWLSTDWETIGVFLSLMAGSPVYFLVFQAVALNLVMASCVFGQKRSYARLVPALDALERG
jgi:hypothetical protein